MPIDYNLLDEGDTLNASSLNTRVANLQTGVNDLTKDDLGEQALRSEHLPSLVRTTDMVPGAMKMTDTPDVITPAYLNFLGSGPTLRSVISIGPAAVATKGYAVISSRTPTGIATPGPFPGIVWEADGSLGTYNFLEQSETGAASATPARDQAKFSDLSTSALITSSDTGGALVARVSGVIASIAVSNDITIREWNMSIIPIFGGTL